MKQEKLMTKKKSDIYRKLITKQENSEIAKKVLTDGLDLYVTDSFEMFFQTCILQN